MEPINPPHVDGEKIPLKELATIFRPPPTLTTIRRNTLVVGSRGAGKTTLLSFLTSSDSRSSVYVSLVDVVGSVAKDTVPSGAGSGEVSAIADRQQARASCFLIAWLLEVASKRNWLPAFALFVEQLPTVLQPAGATNWEAFLHSVDDWIPAADLSVGDARLINNRSPLRKVANLIAAEAAKSEVRVKLLFDRADAIPIACAIPVLELLDQDGEYLALVATRPAPHANLDWGTGVATGLRPDDQYDVIPLGNAPRSLEWRLFVLEAVGAQMPKAVSGAVIPTDLLDAIIYFAADSVRFALQLTHSLFYEASQHTGTDLYTYLTDALDIQQAQMLNRAKARLKAWQSSFSATRLKWREEALRASKQEKLTNPVQVIISRTREQTLLTEEPAPQSIEERFTAACLEDSVLRPPHGEFWVPGSRFSSYEIAPLLLWERGDGIPASFTAQPVTMVMSPGKFLGGSGGGSPIRGGQAFVGLRFTFTTSVQFFQRLKSTLARHPMLGKIDLKNGKLPSGAKWALEIREIIRRCSLMCIADVTGGRGDVLFELGIAYGLGRPIIPVVESADDISRCPYWLRSFNIGVYGNDAGHADLVSSIYDHMYVRRRAPKHRLPAAVPHVAGFLGGGELYDRQLNQFRTLAEKEGVLVEHIPQVTESNYEEAVNLVARSSLLVLVLDDTDQDAFAHFAAGLVNSNPFAGFGNRPLNRQVLVLPDSRETTIPDSLIRAQPTVTVANDPATFLIVIRSFLRSYRQWRS